MANWTTLKTAIANVIKTNGNQEITGQLLQNVLNSIVSSVGANATFAGIATPTTNPGAPDGSMFWLGGKGTYSNFGNSIKIAAGYLGIFMWDGSTFTQTVLKLGGGEGIFDITDYTGNSYASLSDALAAIPQEARAGGMTIRYVSSADNNYVQYRLITQNWSNVVDNWREIQDSLIRKKTNTLKEGEVFKYNIKDYRGEKISVRVTGDFTQYGYYKSSSDFKVLGYTPDIWLTFDVPQDATDLFVYNDVGKGTVTPTMEIRTNIASEVVENTENIATIEATIEGSLGIGTLWSNLFEGSDMKKGYDQNNILAFSTYPSLGGTVEKVLDDETSRYCIKAHFPAGTEFKDSFVAPPLMKNISFTGEDTTQEFSMSFRYKCSPNFKGFCPLCNNDWMQYLNSDGTWEGLFATTLPLVKDNNWHYAHVITRKTDVANKTYSVALYAYFATGSAVTLEEDLDFCITDIVISPSRFSDYAVVRNVNDYISYVDKETLQPTVNEIIKEYPDAYGCVFMSLGDSITTEGYYISKLRQILAPSKYYNLAVAGAHWADYNETTYDGNPVFNGPDNNKNNVLGNQVQKIINNPKTYNVAPDIIIIAAGTNDMTPISADKSDYEMRVDIDSHFNENQTTPIQVTEPTFDDSDTYMSHRKTIAGAMRYCVLKLQSMYPKARIYILTPIQGSYNPNKDYLTAQEVKQRYISEVAKHLAVPVIHVGEECGINRDFEYGGTYWKEEWADENNPEQGRDLIDGLHPNTSGGWKMAKYIARELFNNYVNQDY